MKIKNILVHFFAVVLLMLLGSCSPAPGDQNLLETYSAQTEQANNSLQTIVAGTLAALETQPPAQEPTATAVEPTQSPTFTSTPMPTATLTPVPTAANLVLAEVSVPTNCRTGPGKIFDRVSVLDVKVKAEVIGRNASGTYWIIKNPGGTGHCWLWDRYASLTGNTSSLPIWEEPPTPTPPASPTPSSTGVTLQVRVPTNCRFGPGKGYEIISVLHTGKSVKVVGRHASQDFWVVENPQGSGTCWVWGYYASLTGPKANLPVWDPPPTPTPASVTLKVSVDTYCRTGPGKAYPFITILRSGNLADVVARNSQDTYWVIKNPAGTGTCWVWGKYASLSGSAASLPIWAPPPTPTPDKEP